MFKNGLMNSCPRWIASILSMRPSKLSSFRSFRISKENILERSKPKITATTHRYTKEKMKSPGILSLVAIRRIVQ